MNVAVTVRLFSRITVHTEPFVPLVELQLFQPAKVDEPVAVAVKVSVVPAVNWLLQVDGVEQLTEPVTVPVPLPAKLTVRIG